MEFLAKLIGLIIIMLFLAIPAYIFSVYGF